MAVHTLGGKWLCGGGAQLRRNYRKPACTCYGALSRPGLLIQHQAGKPFQSTGGALQRSAAQWSEDLSRPHCICHEGLGRLGRCRRRVRT